MILFVGALHFQPAYSRDRWHKWSDDRVSGSGMCSRDIQIVFRQFFANTCSPNKNHQAKLILYIEVCSMTMTMFVWLQEEETPLSAGLLSLHVHGTVSICSSYLLLAKKIWKLCFPKKSAYCQRRPLDLIKTSEISLTFYQTPLRHPNTPHIIAIHPPTKHISNTFVRFLILVSPIGTQLADSLAQFQFRFRLNNCRSLSDEQDHHNVKVCTSRMIMSYEQSRLP